MGNNYIPVGLNARPPITENFVWDYKDEFIGAVSFYNAGSTTAYINDNYSIAPGTSVEIELNSNEILYEEIRITFNTGVGRLEWAELKYIQP